MRHRVEGCIFYGAELPTIANHLVHLNLDGAWPIDEMPTLDLRDWGAKLRYHGQRDEVDAFYRQCESQLADFVLYGSGDYHYLAGVLLRRVKKPVVVVSFDNHPDWDIRPPYWACGGWVNRALEMPIVRRVAVWGCGNFELAFPARIFANRRALRNRTLEVHAWAERQSPAVQRKFNCMTRGNWRDRFEQFVKSVAGQDVYVTVDLDCLRNEEAVTNWENGLFTADDVVWALNELHSKAKVVAGDLCGAYSKPSYARWFQKLAGNWDHPRMAEPNEADARRINTAALNAVWPALCGCRF
jgi:arginase family enzyme